MKAAELTRIRVTGRDCKRKKRKEMTEEEREVVRAKDRERKARDRKKKKENIVIERKERKKDSSKWEKKKMKQLIDNCKTQQKLEAQRTEDEKEEIEVGMVERMRLKR